MAKKRPSDHYAEIDYANKLSPTEKAWLVRFNNDHHRGRKNEKLSPEDQAAGYSRNRCANTDLVNQYRQVAQPVDCNQDEWLVATAAKSSAQLDETTTKGKVAPASKYKRDYGADDYNKQCSHADEIEEVFLLAIDSAV